MWPVLLKEEGNRYMNRHKRHYIIVISTHKINPVVVDSYLIHKYIHCSEHGQSNANALLEILQSNLQSKHRLKKEMAFNMHENNCNIGDEQTPSCYRHLPLMEHFDICFKVKYE